MGNSASLMPVISFVKYSSFQKVTMQIIFAHPPAWVAYTISPNPFLATMASAVDLVVLVWSIGEKLGAIPMQSERWTLCYFMCDNVVPSSFDGSWLLRMGRTLWVKDYTPSQVKAEVQKCLFLGTVPNKMLLAKEAIDL
jgi:hypothetical protein